MDFGTQPPPAPHLTEAPPIDPARSYASSPQQRRFPLRNARLVLGLIISGLAFLWLSISNWNKDDPGTHGYFYEHYGQHGNSVAMFITGLVILVPGILLFLKARRDARS